MLIDKALKLDIVEIKPAGLLLSLHGRLQFYNPGRKKKTEERPRITTSCNGQNNRSTLKYNAIKPRIR